MLEAIARVSRWLSAFWHRRRRHATPTSRSRATSVWLAIKSRGFRSFTAYADSEPCLPLAELVTRLGLDAKLEWILHDRLLSEAQDRGAVDHYARSLLVRFLNQAMPQQWSLGICAPSWGFDLALFHVAVTMPAAYRAACLRVGLGYQRAEIAYGWRPESANDPVLVELFTSYWDESSVQLVLTAPTIRPTTTGRQLDPEPQSGEGAPSDGE